MPTYRHRLRLEGLVLATCGLVAAVLLLALEPAARDHAVSTVVQLAVVLALVLTLGPWRTRRELRQATELAPGATGTGEPTPLWQLPVIVAVLTLAFGLGAGADAGLRAAAGCLVVGLGQAVVLARVVAAEEARRARRFFRLPGSRILRGTRLGALPST